MLKNIISEMATIGLKYKRVTTIENMIIMLLSMTVIGYKSDTTNSFVLEAQWNSNIQLNNATLNRSDLDSQIHLNANSNLQIQSGTQDLNLNCGSNSNVQNQTTVNLTGIGSGGCIEF